MRRDRSRKDGFTSMAEIAAHRRTQTVLWLVSLAVLIVGLSAAGLVSGAPTLLWAATLIATSLVKVPTVSGNRWSLAVAVATAAPMLLLRDGRPDLGAILWIYAVWSAGRWMLDTVAPDLAQDHVPTMIRSSVGSAIFAIGFAGLVRAFEGSIGTVVAVAVAAAAWFAFETLLWALSEYGQSRLSRRYLWLMAAQDWPMAVSLFVVGALFAIAWPGLGGWAVLASLIPFSFAYLAFKRSHAARVTYGETIRALSRIPEVAGLSPDGHSDRTAALAVAVAQELDMKPDQVTDVEYAARMHDIGRITLNEPSIIKIGFTEDDIARWGAEIISEAPYLRGVADLVRHQHHPYRRPGEKKDPQLPPASKIIRAASAYDHATNELGFSPLEALEVLHRGAAYDFDPEVVEAVRTVVDLRLLDSTGGSAR